MNMFFQVLSSIHIVALLEIKTALGRVCVFFCSVVFKDRTVLAVGLQAGKIMQMLYSSRNIKCFRSHLSVCLYKHRLIASKIDAKNTIKRQNTGLITSQVINV